MSFLKIILFDIGRIGIASVVLMTVLEDFNSYTSFFSLMKHKKMPAPSLFFFGNIIWKSLAAIALLVHFRIFTTSLILGIYCFLSSFILYDFWCMTGESRHYLRANFLIHLVLCFALILLASFYVVR